MAASVLSAGATIMSGRSQARTLVNQAQQDEITAKGVDLQALQTSERRRENLRAQFASLAANRAARGLSLDTPSAIAVEKEIRRQSVRDENVERLGFVNQSDAYRRSARIRRRGASNAIMASYLSAAGTVWEGAQNAAAAGMPGGKK